MGPYLVFSGVKVLLFLLIYIGRLSSHVTKKYIFLNRLLSIPESPQDVSPLLFCPFQPKVVLGQLHLYFLKVCQNNLKID